MTEIGGVNGNRSSWHTAGLVGLLACLLLQAGCDEYRITMRARGDSIERTISFWNSGKPQKFDADEAAHLAKAYGKEVDAGAHAVTSRFSGATPQDVGGSGSYTRFRSSLGSSHVYMERFRGTNDLVAQVEVANERIEWLTTLIAAWLEAELGEDPAGPVLGRFVRQQFRSDLKNLNFYLIAAQLQDEKSVYARMSQYLVEHEYFSVAELPRIVRKVDDGEDRFLTDYIARLAAKQLGVSRAEPVPEKLGFLTDWDRLVASFETYARGTPEFLRWVEEHPDIEEHEQVEELLEDELDPLFAGFFSGFFSSERRLRIAFELPEPPLETNGVWDDETRRVEWASQALPEVRQPAAFAYVAWAETASEFQQTHFGRVLLEGEALFQYTFTHAGLTAEESSEWDAFVAGLEPGEHLLASIQGFRFADEPLDPEQPADKAPASRAKDLITHLADAIQPAES